MKEVDYVTMAEADAQEAFENFVDEMADMAAGGEVSDDMLNDYRNGDEYHHQSHTDRSYDLSEAAQVLDQLDDYEETDSGLWEGLAPREAIGAQAAYTYGNAVYDKWREKVKELNEYLQGFEFDDDEDRADFCTRFVHAYVFLEGRPDDEFGGLTSGVFTQLLTGEFTGLLVLADRFDENGQGHLATDLRDWATTKYHPEPKEPTDDPGEPEGHPEHHRPDREDHRPEDPAG
jgi:hypothetical protein